MRAKNTVCEITKIEVRHLNPLVYHGVTLCVCGESSCDDNTDYHWQDDDHIVFHYKIHQGEQIIIIYKSVETGLPEVQYLLRFYKETIPDVAINIHKGYQR